jgi:hypothetical protein
MDWNEQGGAAFPVDTHSDTPLHAEPGMSLRDWFAGQALTGILAFAIPGPEKRPENAARDAYAYADALLRQRQFDREEKEYGERDAEMRFYDDPHRHE